MIANTRNRADIFRNQIINQQNGGIRPARDAGDNIGRSATGGVSLAWMENGVPKKWFRWGRTSFDDPNAIFM